MEKWWKRLPEKFPALQLDEWSIMPNHVHGIIMIVGADPCVCPNTGGAPMGAPLQQQNSAETEPKIKLGRIIQWFKTMTTNEYFEDTERDVVINTRKLWQPNYYEHVVRDEDSLNRIREYIASNPYRWELDKENPHRRGEDELDAWLKTFTKQI